MTMFLPAPAVEVFNADYSPLDRVDMQAAVSMLMREVAYALEAHDPPRMLHSPSTAIEVPKSLMLVRYAPVPYRRDRDAASRTEILRRDDHLCQFAGCGAQATTIDHVFPRSRGGSVSSWTNQVAACEPCNNRKAHHTPEEAGMRLLREPFRPAHV
ncbi:MULTISPECIES: HNH endonuclease [unclassified Mycolicibacterium]|uniref:HNH endonuclease n=1 Tax=unclassified Mycolicibacterium TaxID=2636767 RepID=UPI0012DEB850|nr:MULTISPECIES: HNH endonuclease [unclassified Mycolicibacterium]MUL80713.1 HNH endonuclease [Mycolicibacterium sp. CBMA 329]MUL86480.1 HNH endonuclease [Mycolicibacterium sp. CBMA 331]MUM25852.1 HNH endonuclease [Mycolicibacterium sp. CBMA 295]MUM36776.1 HNH endonuclease [Mycolicibacterium sp. CBMA 247]MUM42544.1 HNH endonuclease [Mycolicibacterium sp. CBMA 294]